MEKDLIINEEIYRNYKSEMSKDNDYFTQNELQDLMQFLMQPDFIFLKIGNNLIILLTLKLIEYTCVSI